MSSPHIDNRNRQHSSEMTPAQSSGPLYQTGKLTSIALLVGSASLVLAGCQSSQTMSSPTSKARASSTLMDFSVADSGQSQHQGRAFTASQAAQSNRYEQLFDQEKYPNTDNQAKSHLLAAIRQHLATEHVAVAKANYHVAPFIDADSIDAGASSLLKTIIETYAYNQSSDYDDYVASAELEAAAATNYDENGYDEYGYDEDGYNEYGYDDEGYDQDGYDENGYSRSDYDTEDYAAESYETDDYESDSAFSKLSKLNPKSMTEQYEAMQMAKQQAETETTNNDQSSMTSTGMIGNMLSMIHRTPEQLAASNEYQYKNLMFSSVSQYNPKQRQLQSVYSYDYATPTISASIQIPLAFDFNNSHVTVDPSAIMPIVAIATPENTPLPSQMTSHTVSFGLPEGITEQLPPAVVYDAVLNAIQSSMAEIAPEHFSAVDIREDEFAKEVGATRAVKVYFGSQQSGEMIGKTLKYVTTSLQDYVDANPDKYPDGAMLKAALAKVQLYNKGYQSADVGSLLQLIEAIGPISFNQINYYYLDSSDRLLAKQQRVNIGSDLMGSTTTMLNQVRYDKASFNRHALTPLLAESFGPDATPPIDGNAWMATQREKKDRLQTARYARYDYLGSRVEDAYSSDEYGTDEYGNDNDNGADAVDESRFVDAQDDTNEK
ncbi:MULTISPECIES: hypothetical protein [unclassified Psychrobacter]|uniref:hypothetical protein n=1 Tax=unclassified Psychrobacter TaxID=196806 RepID=UPI0025B53C23|nr:MULTISPECIES: hypothetical protein [unclassified Psychrobacter]MDN3452321.1 hypothetical protein [Psychrobacter sp. APC 3350]MDN3502254.1 hypothetical protein [Psychrobacter sp. 5A.1]